MKKLFLSLIAMLLIGASAYAQRKVAVDTTNYMRSSLYLMLLKDTSVYANADMIKQSFEEVPMPEKYNDHNLSVRVYDNLPSVTQEEIDALDNITYKDTVAVAAEGEGEAPKKKKGGGFGKFMGSLAKGAASETTGGLVGGGVDRKQYAAIANKLMNEKQIAKQLVGKWFINSEGKFTEDLIFERGLYNYSAEDIAAAEASMEGATRLAMNSGYELLNSTFVVANQFNFLPKEEVVAEIQATATGIGSLVGGTVGSFIQMGASIGGGVATAALGDGYFVKITSYLFKLKWNEDIQNKFFETCWDNQAAFDAYDQLELEYVGSDKAFANAGTDPNKGTIYAATVKAIDQVLAKLEFQYDVFKTKTPLTVEIDEASGKPVYSAKIGLKEGLKAGDKYEVLEILFDPETNAKKYKRIGVLKVSKNAIWDNRYGADEELAAKGESQTIDATIFEGNVGKAQSGMLLRQIK